jgi:hypothetical protein
MKKLYRMWVWSMLLLGTLVPSVAMAASEVTPVATPAAESFSPDHLKGRLGFGLIYTNDVSFTYSADIRWWFEDRAALDLLVGGTYAEQKGYGFNGAPNTTPDWNYSLGLGMREVIAEPTADVHVLFAQRLVFSDYLQQSASVSSLYKYQVQALMGFVGLGFEAFVPFWRNLSIEGSVGLKFGARWEEDIQIMNGYGAPDLKYETDYGNFVAGSNNDVTSLLGAGVHFYF